jgi:hypothetical protein
MWAPVRARILFSSSKVSFLGVTFVALALPAVAELGGSVSSIQVDQEHMKGTRQVTTNAAYSVHEIQTATGTKVREFVSPSGTVFGVAWQGPVAPDLRQLLGQYFDQFAQATQNKGVARRQMAVRQKDLVVESGGRMRWFSGRAYLPGMMPQGVTSEVVK